MQENRQDKLSLQIAMGWVMLLLILSVTMVMMIVAGIVADDGFSVIRKDPGKAGMIMIVYLFSVYAVMPIIVSFANGARSSFARWVVVAVTVLLFLFFFLHHVSHWSNGERPAMYTHALEVAHHIIALWVTYLSVRWARTPVAAGVSADRSRATA